jgi:hypothetical protein
MLETARLGRKTTREELVGYLFTGRLARRPGSHPAQHVFFIAQLFWIPNTPKDMADEETG